MCTTPALQASAGTASRCVSPFIDLGRGGGHHRFGPSIDDHMRLSATTCLLSSLLCLFAPTAFAQQCPASLPVQGAPPPGPLPVFPSDNWWNVDISAAPVDASSASFIAFINNGGTRRLHPDFGGEESPGSEGIYGFPYAIVDGTQPKLPVTFDYWDESDGVDRATGQGVPFWS